MCSEEWKLIDRFDMREYRCGLKAGEQVRLLKDVVCKYVDTGRPTGEVYKAGEIWKVMAGSPQDPDVVIFLQPDGKRHFWPDVAADVFEWFQRA